MRRITNPEKDFSAVVRKSASGGLGIFAETPIKKGTVIIEYIGPILTNKQAEEKRGRYLFQINSRKTIYGSGRENIARYVNHSCRPNCEVDIKKGRVFILAKRNIKPGEELAYDYGKEYFDFFIKPHGCRCVKCSEPKKAKQASEKQELGSRPRQEHTSLQSEEA